MGLLGGAAGNIVGVFETAMGNEYDQGHRNTSYIIARVHESLNNT